MTKKPLWVLDIFCHQEARKAEEKYQSPNFQAKANKSHEKFLEG